MARAEHEKALQQLIEKMGAVTPEQARRLVWFAWQCVQGTPLSDGRTPVARLRSHGSFLNVLRTVGCWLQGESVEQPLRAMHDEVFEAALGVGRFEPDMTGRRAACWSVFELYQAAVAAEAGELQVVARKAAWSALLASRSAEKGSAPAALEYQERLLSEALAVQDSLSTCFSLA
jgi:hypothetical protein